MCSLSYNKVYIYIFFIETECNEESDETILFLVRFLFLDVIQMFIYSCRPFFPFPVYGFPNIFRFTKSVLRNKTDYKKDIEHVIKNNVLLLMLI